MFTGLIEEVGVVRSLFSMTRLGGKKAASLTISAPRMSLELKPGDSVAVNGACQTIVRKDASSFTVECLAETLEKTTLGSFQPGQKVNLERAMQLGGRLDGHLVQGHVSEKGLLVAVENSGANRYLTIRLSDAAAGLVIPEGSIALDGISLTIAAINRNEITVNVIPHTWEHTALQGLKAGGQVNIETDMIGRYIARHSKLFSGGAVYAGY